MFTDRTIFINPASISTNNLFHQTQGSIRSIFELISPLLYVSAARYTCRPTYMAGIHVPPYPACHFSALTKLYDTHLFLVNQPPQELSDCSGLDSTEFKAVILGLSPINKCNRIFE